MDLRIWYFWSINIDWVTENDFALAAYLDSDMSSLTPRISPGVADYPVFGAFIVGIPTDNSHCMQIVIFAVALVEDTLSMNFEEVINLKACSDRAPLKSGFAIRLCININDLNGNFAGTEPAFALESNVLIVTLFHLATSFLNVCECQIYPAWFATFVFIGTVDHLLLRELNLSTIFYWVHSFNSCSCGKCPAWATLALIFYSVHIWSPVNGNKTIAFYLLWRCLEGFFVPTVDFSTRFFEKFVGTHIWELFDSHEPGLIFLGVVFSRHFYFLFQNRLAHLVLAEVLVGLPILGKMLDECTVTVLYQAAFWEWETVKDEDHNCGCIYID